MYKITIEVQFRAAHRLLEPYKGKCNNLHGEGYTAIIELVSTKLDENGMVVDFGKAKKNIKEWINENWDHAYICKDIYKDDIGFICKDKGFRYFELRKNPTAENMAEHLFYTIKSRIALPDSKVSKVGIVESFRDSIGWYQE